MAYTFLDELVRTGTTQPSSALPSSALPLNQWVTTMRDRIESEIMYQEPIYEMGRRDPELRKLMEAREMAPR